MVAARDASLGHLRVLRRRPRANPESERAARVHRILVVLADGHVVVEPVLVVLSDILEYRFHFITVNVQLSTSIIIHLQNSTVILRSQSSKSAVKSSERIKVSDAEESKEKGNYVGKEYNGVAGGVRAAAEASLSVRLKVVAQASERISHKANGRELLLLRLLWAPLSVGREREREQRDCRGRGRGRVTWTCASITDELAS